MSKEGSFAEIAVALTLATSKLELDLAKTKMIAERIGLSRMGYELIIPGVERDVELVQQGAKLLRELADLEPHVRGLIARKHAGRWFPRFVRQWAQAAQAAVL